MTSTRMQVRVFLCCCVAVCMAVVAIPCSAQSPVPVTGGALSHAASKGVTSPNPHQVETGRVKFAVGNDEWEPGTEFRDSDAWLALTCVHRACVLVPATLRVQPQSWQGHYDDSPTAGQHLQFQIPEPLKGAIVVAWFQRNPALPWLKTGPVHTYEAAPAPGRGALEIQV
ncbi:MAG: hypothetical protein ACREU2_16335, partial [Steroidobacteraceae bacterium]